MYHLTLSGAQCVESLQIGEPELPRRQNTPRRFDDGLAEGDFHTDVEAHYHFKAIDLVANCVKERFNQPGYYVYGNLE